MLSRIRNLPLNWVVLIVLVVVAVGSSAGSLINEGEYTAEWRSGWLQNFSTEVFGAIITFAFFELVVGGRKERQKEEQEIEDLKARLIREMGSQDNATALNALREIRERGWLRGDMGILQGGYLSLANLKGANLGRANLEGVDLGEAKLDNVCIANAKFDEKTTLPNGEKWTEETDMTQFGCFVDRDKYWEWRRSQDE